MSAIRALERMLAAGVPLETAMIAARIFEEEFPLAVAERLGKRAPAPSTPDRVWVYVMTEDGPEMPLVKVGISKHPNWRRSQLEKQEGANLYVAHTEGPFSRDVAFSVEQAAHRALAHCRQHGEWFLWPEERVIETVQRVLSEQVA